LTEVGLNGQRGQNVHGHVVWATWNVIALVLSLHLSMAAWIVQLTTTVVVLWTTNLAMNITAQVRPTSVDNLHKYSRRV